MTGDAITASRRVGSATRRPATRKALKSQTRLSRARFSEVHAVGQCWLVAHAPPGEVGGSKPQLLCADDVPKGSPVARTITMP